MKKGTKSRNAGGRMHPIEDPRQMPRRQRPNMYDDMDDVFSRRQRPKRNRNKHK